VEVLLNTLYVQDAQGRRAPRSFDDSGASGAQTKLTVPIHQLEGVVLFGMAHVTPGAMQLCAERGVAVAFLTEWAAHEQGRRSGSGNCSGAAYPVSLADLDDKRAAVARGLVAGKVHNARNLILRAARERRTRPMSVSFSKRRVDWRMFCPHCPRVPTLIAFAATKAMPPVSTSSVPVPHSAAA